MERLRFPLSSTNMASSFDRAAYEQSRVDAYNATVGNLTGYDCPKCRNRGNFAALREDYTLCFIPCKCADIRVVLQKASNSGLLATLSKHTFETFIASDDLQKALKEGAMSYAQGGKGWLLISGQSGSGKTHLCTAVCGQRLHRHQNVRYMSWREEVSRLKALSMEESQRTAMLQELKQAQVLYIDDLFKTGAGSDGNSRPTAADVNLAFEILNYRYLHELDTIVSTELSIPQLVRIDEAVASRILERCGQHVYTIQPDQSRNHRLQNSRRFLPTKA